MLITKSQVKYIQSLAHKKFRDTEGVFVVEGPKITGELLRAPAMRLRAAYGLREWIAGVSENGVGHAAVGATGGSEAGVQGPAFVEVSPAELQRLSALTTPNQVVAVFEKPVFPSRDTTKGVWLVLDSIQDPGNLGTIVRLADWFGLSGVIAGGDSADVFNPKAVQSTMGSVGRVPVLYEDPAMVIRDTGLPVYATVLAGEVVYGLGRMKQGFIVIGNESKGIGAGLLELATRRITIPRVGEAESLNAAVATGIVLSHLVGG
jgi:TrmH family RNA methyltransferase